MLSGKLLITLVGILVAVVAVCGSGKSVVEPWNMGKMTVTAVPGARLANGQTTAIGGNYLDKNPLMGSGKFFSVPSYQAMLNPRFSNTQYGANIKYNTPDRKNLATPCDPLTFGDMVGDEENYAPPKKQVRENYGCSASSQSCGKGGLGIGHKIGNSYEVPPGYTNGNYNKIYDGLTYAGPDGDGLAQPAPVVSRPCTDGSNSDMPIGTMSTMDSLGNPEQVYMFDRYVFANANSRLRAMGDPIRGDLAIHPDPCHSGWFAVNPRINVDLQPGAMNVLGGGSDSQKQLMDLLVNASGGSRTTFGGVNLASPEYNFNMGTQMRTELSQGANAVTVTAFP